VPTPVNNAVRDMVREIENGKRQMSLSNVEDSVFERIKAKGKWLMVKG
jgi:hypothetical protein